jgi:flagellar motor switch protein FliN
MSDSPEDVAAIDPTGSVDPLGNIAVVHDITVTASVEIGRRAIPLGEATKIAEGTIVPLDRQADEPFDLLINGTPVARGEVVQVDNEFGLRITQVLESAADLIIHN